MQETEVVGLQSEMPSLSVVVPTRNRAWLLRLLLPSLARQDVGEPYELIVANNGSTDDTAAVARDAMTNWPCVRLVNVPEPGAARARHAGALAARSPILLFIDDDMQAESDVVTQHLRIHKETPGCCVLGNVVSAPSRHPFERMMAYIYDGSRSTLGKRTPNFEDVWAGHFSVPRDLYLRLGGFDLRFAELGAEDIDFGLRVVRAGVPIRFAQNAQTHHHFTARFGGALRRCYMNGLAFGLLMREMPDLRISGVRRAHSGIGARLLEVGCRAAALVLEPFAYGSGVPPAPLALIYSVGMSNATGRGIRDAERKVFKR